MRTTTPVARGTRDFDAALAAQRRDLIGHCYRMLGSPFEAEDAVQESMARALRHRGSVDPSEVRPWLYRIATNVCLDVLRRRRRQPVASLTDHTDAAGGSTWGDLTERLPAGSYTLPLPPSWLADPADVVLADEDVRLAFVTALQRLPARQRAILVLRDVAAWSAADVAELLETTVTAVNSGLRRARAALASTDPPPPSVPVDAALLARYLDAFRAYDMAGLAAVLAEDVTISMPPFTLCFGSRDPFLQWLEAHRELCVHGAADVLGVGAETTVALWRPAVDGHAEPFAIQTLAGDGRRITSITASLDPELFRLFVGRR